jgi:hypothetical protein
MTHLRGLLAEQTAFNREKRVRFLPGVPMIYKMVVQLEVAADSVEEAVTITKQKLHDGMPTVAKYLVVYSRGEVPEWKPNLEAERKVRG